MSGPVETDGAIMEAPFPRTLTTACGAVEYAEFGTGTALLALHGAMGGYDQGLILARTIGAEGHRAICPSRPGYLGTPLASGDSAERQADLCAALLDTLGIAETAVVAVSGGGPCALQFALRHEKRCKALVLISTCAGKIETSVPVSFLITSKLARWPLFVRVMRDRTLRDIELAARRSVANPYLRRRMLDDATAGPLFRALLASTFDRMAFRLPGTANDIAVTRTRTYPLERISVPTLIVHGIDDRLVPFAQHAAVAAARIPAAELFAVDGGEHVAIFTHRDVVSVRIRQFLDRALASTAEP